MYIFVKLEEYMSKEEIWILIFLERILLFCWFVLVWEDVNVLMVGYVTFDMVVI